jgi:ABC-type transport system involved in multi-copper enzyme maturation permease subunit
MTGGLSRKTVREIWAAVVFLGAGLFAFQIAVALTNPLFQKDITTDWLHVKFIQNILTAFLGAEVGTVFGPSIMNVMVWAHPITLALAWAYALTAFTRLPAGEIDRGTIDVLLGLPLRRGAIYLHESLIAALGGWVVVGSALLGHRLGDGFSGAENGYGFGAALTVAANLYFLLVAVAGLASLLSALCDRRGRAVGISLAILVSSFFMSSFAPFNAVIKRMSVVSLINYYRPFKILEGGEFPLIDFVVLAVVAIVLWLLGLLVFSRRDIRTS